MVRVVDPHEQAHPTRLQDAIYSGNLNTALAAARRERHVDLADAARIVGLAHDQRDLYDRLATRWLLRFITECRPDISDISAAASSLAQMQDPVTPLREVHVPCLIKLSNYRRVGAPGQ